MSIYLGMFSSWDDVIDAFDLSNDIPEPADVFASYDTPSYEGYAVVIIRKPHNLFDMAEGWHCSCYGLEGQYEPTENMPHKAVRRILESTNECWAPDAFRRSALAWLGEDDENLGDGASASCE